MRIVDEERTTVQFLELPECKKFIYLPRTLARDLAERMCSRQSIPQVAVNHLKILALRDDFCNEVGNEKVR